MCRGNRIADRARSRATGRAVIALSSSARCDHACRVERARQDCAGVPCNESGEFTQVRSRLECRRVVNRFSLFEEKKSRILLHPSAHLCKAFHARSLGPVISAFDLARAARRLIHDCVAIEGSATGESDLGAPAREKCNPRCCLQALIRQADREDPTRSGLAGRRILVDVRQSDHKT
jgi:hypothetical protein